MFLSQAGEEAQGRGLLPLPARRACSPIAMFGRFMETDPIGNEAGMNLYAYVENDPVNETDPTGLQCEATEHNVIPVCGSRYTSMPGGGGSPGNASPGANTRINENPDIIVTGRRRSRGLAAGADAVGAQCVGPRISNFFSNNYDPAAAVAAGRNFDVALPLGLSAHESSWGTSPMARTRNNLVGSTPGGDSTSGLRYSSIAANWQAFDRMWGARIVNVGSNAPLFADRLLQDNRGVIGAVDNRGPYNTQIAPGGDPAWRSKVLDTIGGVRRRLPLWLRSRC